MRTIALTYHDVIPLRERAGSGFVGPGAEHYKLSPEQFAAHLDSIQAAGSPPVLATDPVDGSRPQVLLTFDDGGVSALTQTSEMLLARGWRGHFFITTGRIGDGGFLDREQVRDLAAAGHLVGSHSHSHRFMTRLTTEEVREEWRRSREVLEELLEAPVETVSVPTGFYCRRLGVLAEEAGYRRIFTSEPWSSPRRLGKALVYGRFSVVDSTPAARVSALCQARPGALLREWIAWNGRKAARLVLGPGYAWLRERILARSGGG